MLVLRPFNFDTLAVVAYNFAADERLGEAALPSLVIVLVGLGPVTVWREASGAGDDAWGARAAGARPNEHEQSRLSHPKTTRFQFKPAAGGRSARARCYTFRLQARSSAG